MKSREEVIKSVQSEIAAIQKRDGELPKTPYVVLEIIERLKTTTDWTDRDRTKPVGKCIRELVELCIKNPKLKIPNKPQPLKSLYEDAETFEEFEPDPVLQVDWDHPRSVEKFSNSELGSSKKNLVKSARRDKKLRKTG
jgi:hypothetical protein